MVLLGWGGTCTPPTVPDCVTAPLPLALDLADRPDELEFARPEVFLPKTLILTDVAPEFQPDREEPEPVEPERPVPRGDRPAPSFERPLPVEAATMRRAAPPAEACRIESESAPAEIYNPPPDYPSQARRRALEGEALVEVTILPDGLCGEARVLECTGSPLFGQAALEAVKRWRYRPAARNGQAVAAVVSIRFVFRLRA